MLSRREVSSVLFSSILTGLFINKACADIDPERVARSFRGLLHAGFRGFRIYEESVGIDEPIRFTVTLDLEDAAVDSDIASGNIVSYIENGIHVEAFKIFGPLKFSPSSVPTYTFPTRTAGPIPKTKGNKKLILLSADTFVSRRFIVN